MKIRSLFTLYSLLFTLFSVYSYSQVDLNLTLWKAPLYLNFQNLMWQLGYYNRPLSTVIFIVLSILLIIHYSLFIIHVRSKKIELKKLKWWLFIIALILVTGYPLFSHDIFNYIFNAKMVWLYQANPHRQVAAYFIHDVWLRFMRNIHTPAPYAYGWTGLSLIPGILTLTKNLKLSLWSMKIFIALFWGSQLWILQKILKKEFPSKSENYRWFLFAANPLVLIETLIVGHNDVVMIFLGLVSYWFFLRSRRFFSRESFLSLLFLGLSVSIKYATIVLLPLYLIKGFSCHPGAKRSGAIGSPPSKGDSIATRLCLLLQNDIGSWASILLLAVIFTRPDQLHSWYLIWAFSFAVLSKSKLIINLFTALTFGALLRYAPYLYFGNWDPPVYFLRNLIWILSGILFILFWGIKHAVKKIS